MSDSFKIMEMMIVKMGEAIARDGTLEEVNRLQSFAELYARASIAESMLRIADALEAQQPKPKKSNPYIGASIINGKPPAATE